jgi:hypothetical protein
MANNKLIRNGAGPDFTIATNEIASVDWQYVKVAWGADGIATIVDANNGLPVVMGEHRSDYDTGGATSIRSAMGIIVPAAGGAAVIGGDAVFGLKVQVMTMPPAARSTDGISSAFDSSVIMNGNVACAIKQFKANVAASSTDAALITFVAGKILKVTEFRLHAGGTATNLTFNSKPAGAGVAISETFALGANGGRADGFNPTGHFWTTISEGLTCTTSAGSTVGVGGTYIEV